MREELFLAIPPDHAIAPLIVRRIAATCRKYGLRECLTPTDRLHISVLSFGQHAPQLAEFVLRIAATIKAPCFEVSFDRALSFKNSGKRPFVLTAVDGLPGVRAFAAQIAAAFRVKLRSFTPHMTLVWDEQLVLPHDIQPLSWTVREFVLIRSFVGQGRHEILGRWPLEAAPTES